MINGVMIVQGYIGTRGIMKREEEMRSRPAAEFCTCCEAGAAVRRVVGLAALGAMKPASV